MEAFSMSKSRLGFCEKHSGGPCSVTPSLAHVLAVVTALLFIGTPVIYSLFVLRAQAALVAELHAEMTELRERVDRLEALAPIQKSDEDKNLKRILSDFREDQVEEDADGNKESYEDNNFLEKLFGIFELGSETDNTQSEEDRDNIGYHRLNEKMLTEIDSQQMSQEEEDPLGGSYRTSRRRHGDKLSANHHSESDDITWESTNGSEQKAKRTRRQAENRESRRNRNREQKRADRRNRGNRGSTGRREQGSEEAQQQNGGERRQRPRCQCPDVPGESPPQYESAYVHFVGNVSSRVHTHPESLHPLSPRMVNISENLLSDWAYASWTLHRQKAKFALNNGVVTVKELGIYFIYSQVQFFDDHRYNGHVITINGKETFKCAEKPAQNPLSMHTCYVGGLAFLHRNSRVAVRLAFSNRWVNMHKDSSYFGMYKVADL